MDIRIARLSLVLAITLPVYCASAQDFGGPDAVDNTIEDDARITGADIKKRITQPRFDW